MATIMPGGYNWPMSGLDPRRSHHDMGGLPAGAVALTEHDYALWEKRVDALMMLLSQRSKPLLTVDELRRNIAGLVQEPQLVHAWCVNRAPCSPSSVP